VNKYYTKKKKKVIISGWGDQISEDDRVKNNIDKILGKPVNLTQMKKLLNELWTQGEG
jgi:hypothetical protein